MTDDEQAKEENRNRMRALVLDGQQSLREGDLSSGAECMDLLAQRAKIAAVSVCPRCRCRARWMITFSAKGAAILRETSAALCRGWSWKMRMRMRCLVVWGLWCTLSLHFRMRVLPPLIPCRCPKKEGAE